MELAGDRPSWPIAEPEEFRTELKRWIAENWDQQIAADQTAGKLDRRAAQAITDYQAGKAKAI